MNIMHVLYRKAKDLTASERYIAQYVLSKNVEITDMSAAELGSATHTSAPTIVRFCRKLGCDGFTDFKVRFSHDYPEYLRTNTNDMDFNYPFAAESSIQDVMRSIIRIKTISAEELMETLDAAAVEKAVDLIEEATFVDVYGYGTSAIAAGGFIWNMSRINKEARLARSSDSSLNAAIRSTRDHVGIAISYTGGTGGIAEVMRELVHNGVPTISITSNTDNTMARMATVSLCVTTKESVYSKVGAFSSMSATETVLDILYAELYRRSFDANTRYLLDNARRAETRSNPQLDEM